jgi:hypothetical protein
VSTLDPEKTPGKVTLKVEPQESGEEQKARLANELAEAAHDRKVRWWMFVGCLLGLFAVGALGIYLTLHGVEPVSFVAGLKAGKAAKL